MACPTSYEPRRTSTGKNCCKTFSDGNPPKTSLIVHKALQYAHQNSPGESRPQVQKYALMTVAPVQTGTARTSPDVPP